MKKLVFLVSFMNVAGAQEAAMRVAKGLRQHGYETEIWFFYRETYVEHFQDDQGVRILLDTDKPGKLGYAKIVWRLFKKLRAVKPYATVSFLPLGNVLGQFIAALAGVKRRIASARSPVSTYSKPMRLGDALMARLGVYRKIIGVTSEVASHYNQFPSAVRERVSTVYNGITWNPSSKSREEARRALGLPEDGILVASIGRFKTQKNYPFQVEIAGRLKHATLVIAGDGPLKEETERAAAANGGDKHMLFMGNVARADIPDLLAACDIFIQPSLYEGQSNALLESMHQGMPCIVSNVADQRETVLDEDGEPYALLLDLDAPAPWAEALDRWALNADERTIWSMRAKERAQRFTVERQLDGFAAVIESEMT